MLAKVWVKAWEDFYEVQEIKEFKVPTNKQMDKDWVQENAAKKAVAAVRSQTNLLEDMYPYEQFYILNTQIVSGMILEMKVTFHSKLDPSKKKEFRVKVWVKPWLDFYEVQSVEPYKTNNGEEPKEDGTSKPLMGGWTDYDFDMNNEFN